MKDPNVKAAPKLRDPKREIVNDVNARHAAVAAGARASGRVPSSDPASVLAPTTSERFGKFLKRIMPGK